VLELAAKISEKLQSLGKIIQANTRTVLERGERVADAPVALNANSRELDNPRTGTNSNTQTNKEKRDQIN